MKYMQDVSRPALWWVTLSMSRAPPC